MEVDTVKKRLFARLLHVLYSACCVIQCKIIHHRTWRVRVGGGDLEGRMEGSSVQNELPCLHISTSIKKMSDRIIYWPI